MDEFAESFRFFSHDAPHLITTFQGGGATEDDAFVIAPDNSRAGLVVGVFSIAPSPIIPSSGVSANPLTSTEAWKILSNHIRLLLFSRS
jgi:hypothetical protein